MALKTYKPVTPSLRQVVQVDRSELWKGKPVKTLTEGLNQSGGRNNHGRITTRHQGGGHARRYRLIDFKRRKHNMEAVVERLEYDPNRTSFIALVTYKDKTQAYIIAPQHVKAGDVIVSGVKVDVKPGNAMLVKNIPVGTLIHNVEMKPGKGGQIARSAGTYVQLVGRDSGTVQIKLSSGEVRRIPQECMATVGSVSNADHMNAKIGKAGRNRWKGIRPSVRGVVMNPVDHPHGGGEGKSSGGRHPVTPWGKGTKGTKTRNNKRTDHAIIRRANKRKDAQKG
jgi:large subunit ribosomal protein L2